MAWAPIASATRATSVAQINSSWAAGSLGAAVSVNDRVVVKITAVINLSTGVTGVTDGLGNTYTKDQSLTQASVVELSEWSAVVSTAGTPSFTVSWTSTMVSLGLTAQAYSGLATAGGASDIDVKKITGGSAFGTNSADSGTTAASTTAASELKTGGYADDGSAVALTAGTLDGTYTERADNSTTGNGESHLEDRDSGASSSTARATVTNTGGSGSTVMGVIVYKLAAAAGLPTGQASFDTRTPLRTLFAPERSQDLGYVDGTEIWLLKGQDVQFGARGQWKTYDWPNPTLQNPNLELRWWFERYKLMLIGRDVLPAVMDDQPNPTLKRDDINRRTFTDAYKLMLIGKDVLPFTRHDQPNPTLKHDDVNQRTHWWNPLQTLLTFIVQNPFALLSWPNPPLARRPAHQDTQGWYVLSLIGRDAMPFGQTGWPNPQIAVRARDLLTHIWNPLYQLLTVLAAPFAFFDWVVPRRPRTVQDHSESYPLTLIGQDALPFDLTEWPNPQQPRRSIDLLTQAASGFWNLLNVIIQAPFAMLNWPNPLGRRHAHQGTTDSYKLTLIGKDALPFRVTEWPNPLPKRWGISLRGLVDGLRRWLPIPAPSQFPGKLSPSDSYVGTLSMADLSAHITVIEVAVGRTTATDAEAPIGPSDMPAGTIKVTDRLLN